MKRFLILNTIFISLLSFVGCDNYLDDTKMVNVETDANGFLTEAHADQTMVAIYASMHNRDALNGRSALVLFDCASADVKVVRENNSVNNYTFSASTDDTAFGNFWLQMYSVIGRCNSSLELVPNTAASEEKKSRYNSEAKVLRAICYYNLMMAYKEVPLVLKTIDPTDRQALLKGDDTRDVIYSTMIADLEEAIANPNFQWEKAIAAVDKGHVGQATARTILTYYYLTRGWEKNAKPDFEMAKKYAKEVIDQGGYTLEPVLLDAYYKDHSTESIFELGGSSLSTGLGSKVSSWFAPLTAPTGTPPTADLQKFYKGFFKMTATKKLYDAIQTGDARKYLLANSAVGNKIWAPNFLGGSKYAGNKTINDNVKYGIDASFLCAKATGSPQKWYDKISANEGSGATWVVYRLSDVYLLYAEACIKEGNLDNDARMYINKVRERARNAWNAHLPIGSTDIPTHVNGIPADIDASVTGDALLAAMKNERRVELYAEMKRLIDVRRWSLGGANDLELEVNQSGPWAEKYRWFPKPQDQVDLSQGSVKQNTGY